MMTELCGTTKEDAICTLRIEEIDGRMTHYGPHHVDLNTDTGWFDDELPEPPITEVPDLVTPGVL